MNTHINEDGEIFINEGLDLKQIYIPAQIQVRQNSLGYKITNTH